MKTYNVFYAGLLYGQYDRDGWPRSHSFPDGCYCLMTFSDKSHAWYIHMGGGFTPINLADVPNEVRLLTILLT